MLLQNLQISPQRTESNFILDQAVLACRYNMKTKKQKTKTKTKQTNHFGFDSIISLPCHQTRPQKKAQAVFEETNNTLILLGWVYACQRI